MRTDEQIAPSHDSFAGFLISGARAPFDPPRSTDLREFLASPPIPSEPPSASDESGETTPHDAPPTTTAAPSFPETRRRVLIDEDRDVISAIAAELPLLEFETIAQAASPRSIADEAAALAVAEPRAVVAPADILVEFASRAQEADDRQGEQDAAFFGSLLEEGGLVDPSTWLSVGSESYSPLGSSDIDSGRGFQARRSSVGALRSGFDRERPVVGPEQGLTSDSRSDRFEESSPEAFEGVEARLGRIAARLEGAVDRIESTPRFPLTSRIDGFRGRVDE